MFFFYRAAFIFERRNTGATFSLSFNSWFSIQRFSFKALAQNLSVAYFHYSPAWLLFDSVGCNSYYSPVVVETTYVFCIRNGNVGQTEPFQLGEWIERCIIKKPIEDIFPRFWVGLRFCLLCSHKMRIHHLQNLFLWSVWCTIWFNTTSREYPSSTRY